MSLTSSLFDVTSLVKVRFSFYSKTKKNFLHFSILTDYCKTITGCHHGLSTVFSLLEFFL